MNLIHDYVYVDNKGKRIYPQIYMYTDKSHPDWVKIGYTTRKNPEERIREQYGTLLQLDKDPYVIIFVTEAVRYNGVSFTDNLIHRLLREHTNIPNKGEFYKVDDLYTITKLIIDIKRDTNTYDGIQPVSKDSKEYEGSHKIPKIRRGLLKPLTNK